MNTFDHEVPSSNDPNRYYGYTPESLGLVDAATPEAFNSLTRLAMRIFDVPVALISIVQESCDRQFFLSQNGLPDPWRNARQTPLSHSFCQHVKSSGEPLIVRDAREHPLLKSNLAIPELGVIAYLGVPIVMPDGTGTGALCVIQSTPRDWTERDVATLQDLANCVNDEILLRAALLENTKNSETSGRYNAMRESICAAFMCPDLSVRERFSELLRASATALHASSARIIKFDFIGASQVVSYDPNGDYEKQCSHMNMESLTQKVVSENEQISCSDLSAFCQTAHISNPKTRMRGAYAGVPISFDGLPYGVIEFSSSETDG